MEVAADAADADAAEAEMKISHQHPSPHHLVASLGSSIASQQHCLIDGSGQ